MAYEIEHDWITKAGLRAVCAVMLSDGRKRNRCGYVEVPKGHRLHGVAYGTPLDDIPHEAVEDAPIGNKSPILILTAGVGAMAGETLRRSPDVAFDVHGGLTYSGGGDEYPVESSGWWFGFDCGHYNDGEIEPHPEYPRGGIVRSRGYVEHECERLAEQIVAMFPLQLAA